MIFKKLWEFDASLCPDNLENSLFLRVFEDLNLFLTSGTLAMPEQIFHFPHAIFRFQL